MLITWLSCLAAASSVFAEMQALEDDYLSGVSGQSGITLDLETKTTVGELAYFDDGNGIAFQGIRLGGAASVDDYAEFRLEADILADGALAITYKSNNQARLEIEDIRFVNAIGAAPNAADPSIGGLFLDFEIDGATEVRSDATQYIIDTVFSLSNGRLGYRTNGNELFLDGMSIDYNAPGATLDFNINTGAIEYTAANVDLELKAEAVRLSTNSANHGVSNDVSTGSLLPSYGSLWSKLAMSQAFQLAAGGRYGLTGMNLDAQTTITSWDLAWGDDTDWAGAGYWFGALQGQGSVELTNLTIDVVEDLDAAADPLKDYGVGLALGFDELRASIFFDAVVAGETKANIDAYRGNNTLPIKSFGGLGVNLLLASGVYNGVARDNRLLLQSGGNVDAGYQGLRIDTELSIVSPNNESNFVYIDDGRGLMVSGIEAFVDGDITIDVTRQGVLGATAFYDGLRFGFEDLDFGYKTEGFRIAQTSGDGSSLANEDLQAAYAIPGLSGGITGLGFYPGYEGRLNGQVTIGAGGREGADGLKVNADINVSDGLMTIYRETDGDGIWLAGLNYDKHLRDMFVDVTAEGLKIYESESWSRLDVTDLRIGNQVSGASFGRVVMETYELGSERVFAAGGAGAVCVGASGADAASCSTNGGRWSDRGSEGLTVSSIRHFAQSVEAESKRNRFTWEIGRTGEGTAAVVNGTGRQLVFDNFTTNDGDGLSDAYGFRTDQSIDLAGAYVLKKADGADSQGVVGNKGDIKVMNGDGSYRYVSPAAMTASDWDNLPAGMAVRTRTHFKELDFESVNLVHPTGGESTLLFGLKAQNFDITSDITMTPLD
jgi:Family of unknown function (DUF6160)